MSKLGKRMERAREARGLSRQGVARELGYSEKRLNKGARRLEAIEREGLEAADFVRRVARLLGVAWDEVRGLAAADDADRRAAWERWADEPIEPQVFVDYPGRPLIVRFVRIPVPADERDPESARAFAARCAAERGRHIPGAPGRPAAGARLVLTRRVSFLYDERGREYRRDVATYDSGPYLPVFQIGNKRLTMTLTE